MCNGLIRTVNHMLNRVNYTRVFDLTGIIEAVGEVAKSWEVQAQQTNQKIKAKVRVIEDSEAEDEDKTNQSSSSENDQSIEEKTTRQAGLKDRKSVQETVSIDMIVIDTISNVVTSSMSKSQVQGNFSYSLNATYFRPPAANSETEVAILLTI